MATLLADPPAAQAGQQPQAQPPGAARPDVAAAGEPRACESCDAPLAAGQGWCLKCGTAAPGSLTAGSPGWRSGAAVLGAVALLIAGAGAAAYAAFGKSEHKARPALSALARVPATSAPGAVVTPPPPVPGRTTPTPKVGTPTTVKPALPLSKLPKIAAPAITPKPAATVPAVTTPSATTTTPSKPSTGGSSQPTEPEPKSKAILLDTNAASSYNPSALPASNFGDPSLAIDGESTTGWTALADPATAPKMAVGLAIDLKTPQRLGALALVTSTPGMTVQLYGTAAHSLPAAVTDPSWVRLGPALVEKKRRIRLTLGQPKRALHFVLLWISRAPAASGGGSAGRVSVNEIELFPPGK